MKTAHNRKIPRSDKLVFLGVFAILVSGILTSHQLGYFSFGEQELEIVRFSRRKDGSFNLFVKSNPSQIFQTTSVTYDDSNLVFNPNVEEAGRHNGEFARVNNLVVANPGNSKSQVSEAQFRVFQPYPIPIWTIVATALIGVVILMSAIVMVFPEAYSTRAAMRLARGVTIAAFFLVGWIGTSQLIREADLKWDRSEFAAKLDAATNGNSGIVANSVFVGSSKTFRQVSPIIFDQTLSDFGFDNLSYNFGLAGCRALEIPIAIREILQNDKQSNIRYVFVQLERFDWEYQKSNLKSKKTVRSHDLSTLVSICRHYVQHESLTVQSKILLAARRVSTFLRRQNNYGFASDWINRWVRRDKRNLNIKSRVANFENGYYPLDKEESETLIAQNEQFKKRINKIATNEYHPALKQIGCIHRYPKTESGKRLIREIISIVEAHGAIPVFVEPPPVQNESVLAAHKNGIIKYLIRLSDFSTNPELFRHELYFDNAHLNKRGSIQYTKELARQFAKEIRGIRLANETVLSEETR